MPQECFYEKVIKVKADVAALLNLFSDVGIERAAILCLSALVALAFSTILFSFRSQNIIDPLRTKSYEKTLADATHRCRASIRTLNGPLLARCNLGSDLSPRSTTTVADLGLLGAAIYGAILIDQAFTTQSPEQGGGCHCLPNLLDNLWFPRINSCLLCSCLPKPIL
jgi:hypothetical protein